MEAKDKKFIFPFEKLDVWQLSVGLSDFVLSLLEGVPSSKHLRLCGQMESSVVSVAQNIAEGEGRQHRKEFIQFLHIAQGSLFEVVTLAEVFLRRGIFTKNDSIEIRSRCELIDRKLNSVRGIGKRE